MLWFDAQRNQKGVESLQRKIREKDLHSEGETKLPFGLLRFLFSKTTVFEEFGLCLQAPFGYAEK
jgi:hypothetical protein